MGLIRLIFIVITIVSILYGCMVAEEEMMRRAMALVPFLFDLRGVAGVLSQLNWYPQQQQHDGLLARSAKRERK